MNNNGCQTRFTRRPEVHIEPLKRQSTISEGTETGRDSDDDGEQSDDEDDASDEEGSVKKIFEQVREEIRNDRDRTLDGPNLSDYFEKHNEIFAKTDDDDGATLLHLLVDDVKNDVFDQYSPFIKLLIKQQPQLLETRNNDGRTPLYAAVTKKNLKLVQLMCDAYKDADGSLDSVISVRDGNLHNCLHIAIARAALPKLTLFLIEAAGPSSLLAQDNQGRTPLHLAVEYKRCGRKQLEIVRDLVAKADEAIDKRTKGDSLSPYRFHTETKKDVLAKENGRHVDPGLGRSLENKSHPGARTRRENDAAKLIGRGADMISGFFPSRDEAELLRPLKSCSRLASAEQQQKRVSKSKRKKEEAEVTEESAAAISDFLKIHCMCTRSSETVIDFLYGRKQEREICFDLYDLRCSTVSEEQIGEFLSHAKFEDVLQAVTLPNIKAVKKQGASKSNATKRESKQEKKGRDDMVPIFRFLRSKNIKRVMHVIVDDMQQPAHSDEEIERALDGLNVELWDWRKTDVCIEIISNAAPKVREVHLYWSGNNAVLYSWCEFTGLPSLKKLEKVSLHADQGLETRARAESKIGNFLKRLKDHQENLVVEVIFDDLLNRRVDVDGSHTGAAGESAARPHRWLDCMDNFADFIQNVEVPRDIPEPITVALIDDGVDINEQALSSKIKGGRSFCLRSPNLSKAYWVTTGGHGTIMAQLICRVCPNAQLFVLKLDEHRNEYEKRQITAESAAKAVQAATDMKVHIISMSWTIERTPENEKHVGDLENAIGAAAKAGILMFCAASDQGRSSDRSYPGACGTKHIFKIGAAEYSGGPWKWLGDPAAVDFIFPGHHVVSSRSNPARSEKGTPLSGSSVATAIASGLAALVLYCVQLGALGLIDSQKAQKTVTMDDFCDIQRYERMREAFLAIGMTGEKFLEVWNVFDTQTKSRRATPAGSRIDIVIEIATRLKDKKRLG